MGLGIRTTLPEPLDMLIRGGVRGQQRAPMMGTGQQTPISTTQSPNDSVPDENGVPRFADGLIDFAKALAPTFIGAGVGALAGGGEGALIGANAGAKFSEGKAKQETVVAKNRADARAKQTENAISAYDATTKRIQAEAQRDKAQGKGVAEPKYFQSGNVVLRLNPDGTQEELVIGQQKGQFIQTKDGKVLYGVGDGTLTEVYKPQVTETVSVSPEAIMKYNNKLADINDQLVKGTYDINQALTQAQLASQANGIEWTPEEEAVRRSVFGRFAVPERRRAFSQLSSPMQTEVNKTETFIDAVDVVDRLLDNPIVKENIGLVPGTLTQLQAKVNSESLEPEMQRFYSSLKNAFDLLVRNRTGAALSMGEEAFYDTLFGSVKGSPENLRQSLDVQRQSALELIENVYGNGPVPYQETDATRIPTTTIMEILRTNPDNPPENVLKEFRRRKAQGLIIF